ncbi:class I SAM-dependent methyltransferase [Proteinivorax hydrogeniformans]|uniref:Class I SAM-dependent methyltransferase n=1 Tax=Proteinivorax hydrogeniformans TaxID=1826727 RepID=A0AAU8HWI3_9FIRM
MSTGYGTLAKYYDEFMVDFPYNKWALFIDRFMNSGHPILELGCGTGNLTINLKKMGYEITGLDIEPNMLAVAKQKTDEENLNIPLIYGDMINADLSPFSQLLCPNDGINSILDKQELKRFFTRVYNSIDKDGVFIFDVSTLGKLQDMTEHIFCEDYPSITYIWNTRQIKQNNFEFNLTFFEQIKANQYSRQDLSITQRGYQLEDLKGYLYLAGFTNIEVYDDYSAKEITNCDDSHRITFVVKK